MGVGLILVNNHPGVNAYAQLCNFVADHIYLNQDKIRPWHRTCLQRSKSLKPETPLAAMIDDLNKQFSLLRTSHLSIYDAPSARKVWAGQSQETGLEAQYVEGELVVLKVHRNSPAEKSGLRMGDIIYRINNELGTPTLAESSSGVFMIRRQSRITEHRIEAQELKLDEEPELVRLSSKTAVLKVPSFRAEFFEKEKWLTQVRALKKYEKIILDFRGNLGGNFVAGLRFLSPFMCSPQDIGYLWKPRSRQKSEMNLIDDLNDEHQIQILDQSFLVKLWTFEGYDCLTASVAVLVDSRTASTAEMVAQALKDYLGAKILGSASAGQLLVGVWYPVPGLGEGVRISIPEAVYQTRRGHKIEGPGVQVDRVLYYHLQELENGEDSWIKQTIQLF